MEREQPVIGVMTLSLPRERTDLAQSFHQAAVEGLGAADLDVVAHDGLAFTSEAAVQAAQEIEARGADCILCLLGTWVLAPTVVSAVQTVSVPSGIWAAAEPASFSLTAGGIVHGSLDELGIDHKFFYGSPTDERTLKEICSFARAAHAVTGLNGSTMGLIGGRVMGMYTTEVDTSQVKALFGVEVEHVDSLAQYLEAERADADAVAETRSMLASEFGTVAVDDHRLEKSIRVYHSLRKIIKDGGYDFAAVKCQAAMIDNYACSCLAASLINDEGTVLACESDVNAALSMQILKLASGSGPVLFGDVNHVDRDQGMLRIVNCGSMPSLMAKSRKEVDLGRQYDYMGEAGGATIVMCCKPGPVTVARLSRIEGEYVMLIAEGETVDQPRDRFKEAREHWPHMFVSVDGDPDTLIQNLRSNHLHACYGRFVPELLDVCDLLDILPITV
jgi:L-fucose isomerase